MNISPDRAGPDARLRQLILDANAKRPAVFSELIPTLVLTDSEKRWIAKYLQEHEDLGSFHLLMILRAQAPDVCAELPPDNRSRVLCLALQQVEALNDWGYLDPSGSYDGPAASALLETSEAAQGRLLPILDDRSDAPLYGSELATMSSMYGYRRCDFAYRYLCLLLKGTANFAADLPSRDRAIQALKKDLAAEGS